MMLSRGCWWLGLMVVAVSLCANHHARATPMPPPVPAALRDPNTPAHAGDEEADPSSAAADDAQAAPEKRLFKYFLPGSPAWVSSPDTEDYQESAKRGYGKNYLRFGRSDDDKRGGRNFLRFGRGDTSDYELSDDDLEYSPEKRNRNFLRFGRNRNFLRFGRSGEPDNALASERGPMEFANGLMDEEELPIEEQKRGPHRNYLRFGRGNRNFLRFGRSDNRNFLRFGRSVDRQLTSEIDKDNTFDFASSSTSSPKPGQTITASKRDVSSAAVNDGASKTQETTAVNPRRSKRSAPGYYNDYMVLPSHGPVSWARDFSEPQEMDDLVELEEASAPQESQDVNKRSYNRSFLRFGRDRNFLRFGKRDQGTSDINSSSSSAPESTGPVLVMRPAEYPRFVRASQRNFLRFG